MNREATVESVQRYRAKAARRPILFWWQAFLLLGGTLFLWSRLPVAAVLFEARVVPPLSEPHAAYVTLDPAYAAQVFKKTMMAWTLGGKGEKLSPGLDIALAELDHALQPPEFLVQGSRYPGVWRPSAVEPLAQRLPEMKMPFSGEPSAAAGVPLPPQGIRAVLDSALAAAAFSFPVPTNRLPERSGHGRYYLETDADGLVAHVLLLSSRTEAMPVLEQALSRGQARGAARGFVELLWNYSKP
jgi:hypothetical protein